jgi:hypothetical protein
MVKSRTRILVESRKLLHVVTDPNTPGTEPYDTPSNDISNAKCLASAKNADTIANDESTQFNEAPFSYTMYASVSGTNIT